MSSEESNQDHLRLGESIVRRISETISSVKEGIKTQPQANSFFYSHAARFSFQKEKTDIPAWTWTNPRSASLSIRQIQLIFDDPVSDSEFAPFVTVKCGEATLFDCEESNTPFIKADLSLLYTEGKSIKRHEKLEVFVHYGGSLTGNRRATISVDIGEA